jgi:hypothetical protein
VNGSSAVASVRPGKIRFEVLLDEDRLQTVDWSQTKVLAHNHENLDQDPAGVFVAVGWTKETVAKKESLVLARGPKNLCENFLACRVTEYFSTGEEDALTRVKACFQEAIAASRELADCDSDTPWEVQSRHNWTIHEQTRLAAMIAKPFGTNPQFDYVAGRVKDLRGQANIRIFGEKVYGVAFHFGEEVLLTQNDFPSIDWESVEAAVPIKVLDLPILEEARRKRITLPPVFDHAVMYSKGRDDLDGRVLVFGTQEGCDLVLALCRDEAMQNKMHQEAVNQTPVVLGEVLTALQNGEKLVGELGKKFSQVLTLASNNGIEVDRKVLAQIQTAALASSNK